MKTPSLAKTPRFFLAAIALIFVSLSAAPSPAQTVLGTRQPNTSRIQFQQPTTSVVDAPSGRRRGGASRTGNCPDVAQPLTALVPAVDDAVLGLTTAAHPTLWFYVPYALNADYPAEFALLDDRNRYVYQTVLASAQSNTTGIVQIAIPDTVTLESNKLYRWAFTVNCSVGSAIFTTGGIQRVALDPALHTQIDQATGLAKANLYAQNGIWFDALTTLAALKQEQPDDTTIATEWQNLLRSVELEEVADQPFVPSFLPN